MAISEYIAERTVPDPVYLITQREAVQIEDGKPIVLDPGFLLTNELTEDGETTDGLLVYLSRRSADLFLAWRNDPALVVGVFRNLIDLADHIEQAGYKWIILNKIPGEIDGAFVRAARFVDQIRA